MRGVTAKSLDAPAFGSPTSSGLGGEAQSSAAWDPEGFWGFGFGEVVFLVVFGSEMFFGFCRVLFEVQRVCSF